MMDRCPFGCILGMPHAHERSLVIDGKVARRLSWLERFLYDNFWIEPREMRADRKQLSYSRRPVI